MREYDLRVHLIGCRLWGKHLLIAIGMPCEHYSVYEGYREKYQVSQFF